MPGTATPAAVTWYGDTRINFEPDPTRNPVPSFAVNSNDCLDSLTYGQRDVLRAVHEAAHAVAILAASGYVHDVMIRTTAWLQGQPATGAGVVGGEARGCNFPGGPAFVTVLTAGERAEDRWLRENGLWTSTLAAGVELGARGDRLTILTANPHIGFGTGQDYSTVHDLGDRFVDEHWTRILAVAEALVSRCHLTGDEAASHAGLPNGTHSATCTFT
jgi:hypothetical protein